MKFASMLAAACLMTATAALAQPATTDKGNAQVLKSIPPESTTVTNYYKQDVYDPNNAKIGDIKDVLIDHEGKIAVLIIGAGGFLGMGEHDVAVPFSAVKGTQKDGKWYLTMSASKDELKAAPAFKYDRTKTTWVPDTSNTTGSGNNTAPKGNTSR